MGGFVNCILHNLNSREWHEGVAAVNDLLQNFVCIYARWAIEYANSIEMHKIRFWPQISRTHLPNRNYTADDKMYGDVVLVHQARDIHIYTLHKHSRHTHTHTYKHEIHSIVRRGKTISKAKYKQRCHVVHHQGSGVKPETTPDCVCFCVCLTVFSFIQDHFRICYF